MDYNLLRLLCPWDFPGNNTGVGCHFLLQEIFPTPGLTQVSRIVGRCFTIWTIREIKESESQVTQSCLTLCDPMDCSLPGFSVHGIFQARILQWVAIFFSRRSCSSSSWTRDWTQVSRIVGRRFTVWATREVLKGFPCSSAGKESACNEGDLGSLPGMGRSPGEGKGYPLQYSGLENSM